MKRCQYLRDTRTVSTAFNISGNEVPAVNNAVECCGFESVCPKRQIKCRISQMCWKVE